jgi:tRNA (guanine-N7-)-methyltransferase
LENWVFTEEEAPLHKGRWREALGFESTVPVDLEIGTGNGYFFSHQAHSNPSRVLLGMELKYKPLVQTIKRALRMGTTNAFVLRYHANLLNELFDSQELNNVFIYFPDPWPKKRHWKNRLVQDDFLEMLFNIQRAGSFLEIKTDNPEYFDWIIERIPKSPYQQSRFSRDLHNSEWASENFQTHFEKLWTSKGLKTHMVRLERR